MVADLPAFDARVAYFAGLADAMRDQGVRLSKISSGQELAGKYADELRDASGKVSKDLEQVVGRYDAVVGALREFRPALEAGLSGSAQALDDAMDARAAQAQAQLLPVITAGLETPLTPAQEEANAEQSAAVQAAAARLSAAKARLDGVLSALDEAGRLAAGAIRAGFHDGLTDSGWDKFKYAFKKFLEILVKVLTYIGMALAAIAILIPGVGELVLAAGLAIGAVVLVADLGLKALGGGSWLSIGLDVAGLFTFGAGKLLGPVVKSAGNALKGGFKSASKWADDAFGDAAKSKGAAKSNSEACTNGDPVDVATGDVLMTETDVALPGALPLVIERTHRSSWRTGRWFGPGWSSTLDQRLQLDGETVHGLFAEGRVLTWPLPLDGAPVIAETGPVWTLRRVASAAFEVHDPQRGLTWTYEMPGATSDTAGADEIPIAAVADRAGFEVKFGYDTDGAPATVTHSGGYRVDVTVTDGLVRALHLHGESEPLRRFTYGESGDLIGVIDSSDLPLQHSYDNDGRLTGWVDRNGQFYRYSYDEQGRCIAGDGPAGALSGTFEYAADATRWTDSAGAVTTYKFSLSGLLTALTDPLGATSRWDYDARQNVIAEIDSLGRATRFSYDDAGNMTAVVRPDGTTLMAEYDARNLLIAVIRPDGTVWRQQFDERGNPTSVIEPDGTTTAFEYVDANSLTRDEGGAGPVTHVVLDAVGTAVAVAAPNGTLTAYELDSRGRIARITAPGGGVTTQTWTSEGRLASRTFADGASETFDWDAEGNLIRKIDAVGLVTSYEYGPFDYVTAELAPDGTRTEFEYDHALRITTVRRGGRAWQFEYDAAGRPVSETDFRGATTRYEYDAAGQRVRQWNAAGQETTFAYDLLGNLAERVSDGSRATFGRDAAGNMLWARNADAIVHFERDRLGRVVTETVNGHSVTTEFDRAGRVSSRVTPSGLTTAWEFDALGRVSAATSAGHRQQFSYDAVDQQIGRELPGGVVVAQEWDRGGRLVMQSLSAAGRTLQQRTYGYRPDGTPDRVDDLLDGSRSLTLDPLSRVTAVTGRDWSEQYSYDATGNVASGSWSLPSGSAGVNDVRYRRDSAGRVVSRTRARGADASETWTYDWDADNRLVAVSTPDGGVWRYLYDPFGRRIAKRQFSPRGALVGETRYIWDGFILVEQVERGDSGERVTSWGYRPQSFTPILQIERDAIDGSSDDELDCRFYAIVTDLTGAPTELIAEDGSLAGRQHRAHWGATFWDGKSTPLRFPGQYADAETGLHYNNQRYYDPLTGSYLTPDPLGLEGGPDNYAYVANPYLLIDPLGLQGCKEYTHIATDKKNVGTSKLRDDFNTYGLQTAEHRGFDLAEGSKKMGHHQHVFMWDDSTKGINGAKGIVDGVGEDGSVTLRIRWDALEEKSSWIPWRKPNLKGDHPTHLGGESTNGAWAYEGDIPRKYVFIEGLDSKSTPGYYGWLAGRGWDFM